MTLFDENSKPKSPVRRIVGWSVGFVFAFGAFFLVAVPSPYLVENPGPVYNVLSDVGGTPIISIEDQKSYPTSGELDMLTVVQSGTANRGASWLSVGLAMFDPSQSIIAISDVYPPGWDEEKRNEEADLMMLDSQANAKAAALTLLDIPYESSVKVTVVEKKGPAGGILKAGDTLLTIEGEIATGIDQVRAFVAATEGKRTVKLVVERAGKEVALEVLPKLIEEQWRMGIFVQNVPTFPFEIDIEIGNVGGPSGGQILALAIYDKLTPGALTGGKQIAGTGTVSPEGLIGPIGGVVQKMYGAVRAGANWMLVPAKNCSEVLGNIPEGLNVIKVSNLDDSLKAVDAIARGVSTNQLPTCKK